MRKLICANCNCYTPIATDTDTKFNKKKKINK